MGRSPCCSKEGLNRGAWTALEDKILVSYIKTHGEGKWRSLPTRAGLKRCGKSCRLRWLNYLRPDIKRGNISDEEEELIIRLHKLLGNRWSLIAGRLPGRTDNEIKNYWNTTLGKKVQQASANSPGKHNSSPSPKSKRKKPIGEYSSCTTSSPANTTTSAIRTKASKCTKVFLPPTCDPPGNLLDPNATYLTTDMDVEGVKNPAMFPVEETLPPVGGSSAVDSDDGKDSGGSDVMLFDEAMLEDWLGLDCSGLQMDVGADLHSLASLLESEEWMDGSGNANNGDTN